MFSSIPMLFPPTESRIWLSSIITSDGWAMPRHAVRSAVTEEQVSPINDSLYAMEYCLVSNIQNSGAVGLTFFAGVT